MKAAKVLVIMLAVMLPLMAFAAIPETGKKAKTIDELAAKYDSSSCKECHADIYADWEKSLHSRSMVGPHESARTLATVRTAITNGMMEWPYSGVKKPEDVKIKHLMICATCHLPQLVEAEDSVAQEFVQNMYKYLDGGREDLKAEEKLTKININCLICHNRNAIIHKWADGFPQGDAVYGTKSGSHAAPGFPKLLMAPEMKESTLCGQCHGLGPQFFLDEPTQCGTLYGYYLWNYIAEGGTERCQECHMKKSGLGHNIQSYRSEAMRKMAIDFNTDAYAYIWRDGTILTPLAHLEVKITNKAGHAFPDG
jgi:Cytochrome c554 and c-prime